jgi:nitroimidazol reductase NimA-like FMN-containing flavoprotein (pyridoxamine 5'-phosphate oxidase superfamily)
MVTEELAWSHGSLLDLPTEECWRLLASHSVGRVAWAGPDGPTVLPVNFAVAGTEVWFRTTAHSSFAREIDDLPVAFQVDDVDDFTRSGWSVLIRGTARVVYDATRLPRTWPGTETWPAGAHALHVVVEPDHVTGRRLLAS